MIGDEFKRAVFRDTKTYYDNADETVFGAQLIAFTKRHAGHTIVDVGCATGNYCMILTRSGFEMTGVDVNPRYVEQAVAKGVNAVAVSGPMPFADGAFDSAIMFEVLEHVPDPEPVIREVRRVVRKNALFTVPNSAGVIEMRQRGVIFEHFADMDHKNFFTKESLHRLLAPHFSRVTVTEGDPIHPVTLFGGPVAQFIVKVLFKLKLITPRYYFRLFVVAEV